jgi:hypothetical protein
MSSIPDLGADGMAALESQLQADAIAVRDSLDGIMRRFSWIKLLGEDNVGSDLFHAYSYLETVARVYYGLAVQPSAFNFDDRLAAARRGL